MLPVHGFDHVSLPTHDMERLLAFYKRLGFPIVNEDAWRSGEAKVVAIQAGADAKINVHTPELWTDERFTLRGPTAQPGCGDLCFRYPGSIETAEQWLREAGAEIAYGPVRQAGGAGAGRRMGVSIYTRDPDGNLLEFMTYPEAGAAAEA